MHQHRGREVPTGKHVCDMSQMLTNLVAIGCIGSLISFYFDRPAIGVQPEVMGRLVVRKAHHLIPLLINVVMVLARSQKQWENQM